MAITVIEYNALTHLRDQGLAPQGGSILELGEQNWYWDIPLTPLIDKIKQTLPAGDLRREELIGELQGIQAIRDTSQDEAERRAGSFKAARLLCRYVFDNVSYDAIDFHGTEEALQHDLNKPMKGKKLYDVIINIGTAEHVFYAGQVFKTIREKTKLGGMMIHTAPMSGWWDHGFFSFHPTLYFDLAAANGYKMVAAIVASLNPPSLQALNSHAAFHELAKQGKVGTHANMICIMTKVTDQPFTVPMQGLYFGEVSDDMAQAWRGAR